MVTGCQAGDLEGPYAERFEQELAGDLSNFQREVLSDHEITRAEYDDASDQFVACMEDRGFRVSREWQLAYYVTITEPGQAAEAAYDECQEEYLIPLGPLFIETTTNPENLPWDQAVAECLVRLGVTPDGFDDSDVTAIQMGEHSDLTMETPDAPNTPYTLICDEPLLGPFPEVAVELTRARG